MTGLQEKGFEIIENIYSKKEANEIIEVVENQAVRGRFGVREFLFDNPLIAEKVFNQKLRKIIKNISPNCTKSIKSIYFDKPPNAN